MKRRSRSLRPRGVRSDSAVTMVSESSDRRPRAHERVDERVRLADRDRQAQHDVLADAAQRGFDAGVRAAKRTGAGGLMPQFKIPAIGQKLLAALSAPVKVTRQLRSPLEISSSSAAARTAPSRRCATVQVSFQSPWPTPKSRRLIWPSLSARRRRPCCSKVNSIGTSLRHIAQRELAGRADTCCRPCR